MADLRLRVRYYQDSTPPGIPCIEKNFIRREIVMPLLVEETALVLVDLWNVHHIKSWMERAKDVTVKAIVPVMDKARAAGLTIIQAPSPEVARKYRLSTQYASDEDVFVAPRVYDWPPEDFVERKGHYRVFAHPCKQPPGVGEKYKELRIPSLDLPDAVKLHSDDYMIRTGSQLHRLLKHKHILHLIYAGFATNWCILGRDYGMRAMSQRGYNTILLRDSTTGVEWPDTVDSLFATELAVREVEVQVGFSASNKDFFNACQEVV